MKTASITLDRISTTRRIPKQRSFRSLDVMVAAIGLTVSVAGFLSREITWAFAGA